MNWARLSASNAFLVLEPVISRYAYQSARIVDSVLGLKKERRLAPIPKLKKTDGNCKQTASFATTRQSRGSHLSIRQKFR